MITSYLSQVAEFQRAFRHPIPDAPDLCDPVTNALRPALIAEELHELRKAIDDNDRLEILDALCDIEYVLAGAVLSWGLVQQFDAPTITLSLRKIPDMDAHLAEMFGLNAMMEIVCESRNSASVAMNLRELQSHLSRLVWHWGFSECFARAFAVVHANNLAKLWSLDQMKDWMVATNLGEELSFEETIGGFIARRKDGKIQKPAFHSKVDLSIFI